MPELPPAEVSMWWLTLGIGFAVVLVVILLLSFLIMLVKIIDRNVVDVRNTAKAITQNTANTKLIAPTAQGVDAVLAEGLRHHLFLGRVHGKVRT